jgi:psp operon transcriptional activator
VKNIIRRNFTRLSAAGSPGEALGQSDAFLAFQERLSRVAPVARPVLIIGERGSGKELAAIRLHFLSKRWQGALVALNCSALSSSLLESELFGHEKGAFTGAVQKRSGRFEAADGGTLFLDEIGTLPLEVQEKILRVVEYGSFERVGGSVPVEVDVRIVAATNADLALLAQQGRFKQDLLDRLSFEVLFLPPLRARKGDILLLADHFAARMAFELGRSEIPRFSSEAVEALENYPWPGNVRELKNVVERAVYRSDSSTLQRIEFNPFRSSDRLLQVPSPVPPTEPAARAQTGPNPPQMPLKQAVWEFKRNAIENALRVAHYNQAAAARCLGLTYHQFRGLYRQYQAEQKKTAPRKTEAPLQRNSNS